MYRFMSTKPKKAAYTLAFSRINLGVFRFNHNLHSLILNFLFAAAAFTGLGCYFYQSGRTSLVPYIVESHDNGLLVYKGVLEPHNLTDSRIIGSQICAFVQNLRQRTLDRSLVRNSLKYVYSMLEPNSGASHVINQMLEQENPFASDERESVEVKFDSIIALSDNSYKIEWHELRYSKDGALAEEAPYSCTVSYHLEDLKNPDRELLRFNPIGLVIDTFFFGQDPFKTVDLK